MVRLLNFRAHLKSVPFANQPLFTIQNPDEMGFQIPTIAPLFKCVRNLSGWYSDPDCRDSTPCKNNRRFRHFHFVKLRIPSFYPCSVEMLEQEPGSPKHIAVEMDSTVECLKHKNNFEIEIW